MFVLVGIYYRSISSMVIANDACSIEKKIKKIEIKDIQGSELRFGAQGSVI